MSFWSRYYHTSFGDDYEYDFDGPEETRKAFTDVRFRRSDGTFELKSISWCEANGAVERDGYWEAPTSDLYEDESDPSQPFAGLDRLWEWDFMSVLSRPPSKTGWSWSLWTTCCNRTSERVPSEGECPGCFGRREEGKMALQ